MPLLVLSLRAIIRQDWTVALLWASSMMLVKEDSAFLIVGIGLMLALMGMRRVAAVYMAIGVSSFLLITVYIIPRFNVNGHYDYWDKTSADSATMAGRLGGPFLTLVKALGFGVSWETLGLLVLCTAGLCLRSPMILVAVPSLMARFTSPNEMYWGPSYHYNATLMIVAFVAMLDGLRRCEPQLLELKRLAQSSWWPSAKVARPSSRRLSTYVVAIVLVCNLSVLQDFSLWREFPGNSPVCKGCNGIQRLLNEIPRRATNIAADEALLAHLRRPGSAHIISSAFGTWDGSQFRADWVLMNTGRAGGLALAGRLVTHQYVPVDRSGPYLLLQWYPNASAGYCEPAVPPEPWCPAVTPG